MTLLINIISSSIIVLILPVILNQLIFKNFKEIYELTLSPLITSLVMFCVLILLNNLASQNECKKQKTLYSMKSSYPTAIVIFIVYYLIILMPFFLNPIMKLSEPFGHPKIFNRLGIGYYLMMAIWGTIIIGYFNVIKDSCKLDKEYVKKYKKDIWKELQTETKDVLKTVKIT